MGCWKGERKCCEYVGTGGTGGCGGREAGGPELGCGGREAGGPELGCGGKEAGGGGPELGCGGREVGGGPELASWEGGGGWEGCCAGGDGFNSMASSSLSISMSPTSVKSSLQEGSEVAVCWALSISFWRALSFSRQLLSCEATDLYICTNIGNGVG